jgi:hypothetical protein
VQDLPSMSRYVTKHIEGQVFWLCSRHIGPVVSTKNSMSSTGTTLWLMTPGFRKYRSLTLSKHLFIYKLIKTILHGLSIPNPNFSEFAFFGE